MDTKFAKFRFLTKIFIEYLPKFRFFYQNSDFFTKI